LQQTPTAKSLARPLAWSHPEGVPKRVVVKGLAIGFAMCFVGIIWAADVGRLRVILDLIERVPYFDKLGHLVLVGTLSCLCHLAIHARAGSPWWRVTVTTWVLWGLLTIEEISQHFLPHRHCDLADWLADVAGLALAHGCWWCWVNRKSRGVLQGDADPG
jgi:polysaccharide biosynthesis protein VpsQ